MAALNILIKVAIILTRCDAKNVYSHIIKGLSINKANVSCSQTCWYDAKKKSLMMTKTYLTEESENPQVCLLVEQVLCM